MYVTDLLCKLDDHESTDFDVKYPQQGANHDLISAQLRFATLLRQARIIKQDLRHSAHDFELAADHDFPRITSSHDPAER
jgi:hypothetical protein